MTSDDEVAVFSDTNLGTHLAIAVSPDTTVGDFQREFERAHHSCFPELGKIEVRALMVWRKSCFYHLPSSLPIKYAFQNQVGEWFLRIEARNFKDSDDPCLCNFAANEDGDRKFNDNHLTDSLVRNTGEGTAIGKKAEFANASELNSGSMTKNQTNISSRTISAGGVIDGCLLTGSGVSRHASSPGSCRAMQGVPEEQLRTKTDNRSIQTGPSPAFMVQTPPKESLFRSPADQDTGTRRDRFRSSGVGKRVVVASNNIRISDRQNPITPLGNFRDGKLLCYKNLRRRAKFLVFEISDSDEEDVINAL